MNVRSFSARFTKKTVSLITRSSLQLGAALTALAVLSALPILAQTANFDPLNLSPGSADSPRTVQGFTGGSFSLSAIANRDRNRNLCLGFADSTPDHIMTLQQNFPQLTLRVDSGGNDTTLVIQGPNDTIWCGDDTGRNKDASIQDTNWPSGTYRIWIGAFEAGARYDYTLTARE